MVKFLCHVEADKPVDVLWFHGHQVVKPSDNVDLSKIKNKHVLTIFDAKKEHEGFYSCAAFNKSLEEWRNFSLKLTEASKPKSAPAILNQVEDVSVMENKPVSFTFSVKGHPEPRMLFFRNGKPLKSNELVSIGNQNLINNAKIIINEA